MNNCFFNHPFPIICPFINLDCQQNTVVNPILPSNFAFFTNPSPGTVLAGANIPLTIANFLGNSFIPNGFGGINLQAGTYEITYSASAVVPDSGSVSIGLTFGGTVVSGSTVTVSQTAGDNVNLSRTLVLTLTQSGTLYLASLGASAVDFSFASMFMRAL